jgi:hypothetical protein
VPESTRVMKATNSSSLKRSILRLSSRSQNTMKSSPLTSSKSSRLTKANSGTMTTLRLKLKLQAPKKPHLMLRHSLEMMMPLLSRTSSPLTSPTPSLTCPTTFPSTSH